jgi:hypothetical protein
MNRKQQILETITHIFEISATENGGHGDGSDPKRVQRLARMIGRALKGKEKRTEEAVKERLGRGKRGKFPKFKSKEEKD